MPQKRTRQSKPKVKTGCQECRFRNRRVKCDETRPNCLRCVKSNKECPGYPAPPRNRNAPVVPLAPKMCPRPPHAGALVSASDAGHGPLQAVTLSSKQPPTLTCMGLPSPATTFTLAIGQARSPQLGWQSGASFMPLGGASDLPLSGLGISPQLSPVLPEQFQSLLFGMSPTRYQPPLAYWSSDENTYFQLFHARIAQELSGYFDAGFWTRSLLQAAAVEPAVRHTVVALGALYRTLDAVHSRSSTRRTHWQAAIGSYDKAMAEMRKFTLDPEAIRTQLISHVLLACFDSFVGDYEKAIVQIQGGLKLMKNLYNDLLLPSSTVTVDQDLIRMFTRLAVQAKSYDMAFHFPEPYVLRLSQGPPLNHGPLTFRAAGFDTPSPKASPASGSIFTYKPFPDLMTARVVWDELLYEIFQLTETLFTIAKQTSSNGPVGLLPSSLSSRKTIVFQKLLSWGAAFDGLLRTRHTQSFQIKAGLATLRMFYLIVCILLAMSFVDSEMAFDAHTSKFKEIVNLALEVVADQERQAAAAMGCAAGYNCVHVDRRVDIFHCWPSDLLTYHIKPSFIADLGIVQPLYVVATKCRDGFLRRQAIQLLCNSARREAMWDSGLCARIGQWIVEVEERGIFCPYGPTTTADLSTEVQLMPDQSFSTSLAQPSSATATTSPTTAAGPSVIPSPMLPPSLGSPLVAMMESPGEEFSRPYHELQPPSLVPAENRVMISSVKMDLISRKATVRCATRGIQTDKVDTRAEEKTLYF